MYNELKCNDGACVPTTEPPKELQVPDQISRQSEMLEHFQDTMDRAENLLTLLSERTAPVRTSVPTHPDSRPVDPQAPQQALVPVADAIRSNNQTIVSLIDRLMNVMGRIRAINDTLQI